MKTVLPSYIDDKRPMILRTTEQRLLAEILNTLEKLVKLVSPEAKTKSNVKEKR